MSKITASELNQFKENKVTSKILQDNENIELKIKNRYLAQREDQLTRLLIEAHIKIVQLERKLNE